VPVRARGSERPRGATLPTVRMRKLLGLAGLAGVAATGAVVARNERQRRAGTPDGVRARPHERPAAPATAPQPEPPTAAELTAGRAHRVARLLRRPGIGPEEPFRRP
jgi:hypothetical protein